MRRPAGKSVGGSVEGGDRDREKAMETTGKRIRREKDGTLEVKKNGGKKSSA